MEPFIFFLCHTWWHLLTENLYQLINNELNSLAAAVLTQAPGADLSGLWCVKGLSMKTPLPCSLHMPISTWSVVAHSYSPVSGKLYFCILIFRPDTTFVMMCSWGVFWYMRSVHSEMVTTSRPSWKTAPSLDCDTYIINDTLLLTANNTALFMVFLRH
jgi:hypothetical protein